MYRKNSGNIYMKWTLKNCNRLEHSSHHRRGLTLVELLVMIFFIVILAAMLIPSFGPNGHAYELARQAACKANLQEIGEAFRLYSQQNNSQWPLLADDADYMQPSFPDSSQADTIWDEKNNPIIGVGAMQNIWILVYHDLIDQSVFQCPSDPHWIKRSATAPWYGWGNDNEYSYGMHAGYKKFYGQKNPAALTPDTDGKIVIMSDQNRGNLSRYSAYNPDTGIAPANHNQYGVSYLLANGTVRWYQWDESVLEGLPVGPGGDNVFITDNLYKPDLPIHPKDCYIVPKP